MKKILGLAIAFALVLSAVSAIAADQNPTTTSKPAVTTEKAPVTANTIPTTVTKNPVPTTETKSTTAVKATEKTTTETTATLTNKEWETKANKTCLGKNFKVGTPEYESCYKSELNNLKSAQAKVTEKATTETTKTPVKAMETTKTPDTKPLTTKAPEAQKVK